VGNRGYSLRPWKQEVSEVPDAMARLRDEPVVLVQSGLFPHAGYDERHLLLTPETLRDPRNRGAAMLLAPTVSAYPFSREELAALLPLEPAGAMPPSLVAVRVPPSSDGLPAPQPRSRGERRRARRGTSGRPALP
jgi:hypothetical protein